MCMQQDTEMLYYNEETPHIKSTYEHKLLRLFRKLPQDERKLLLERMSELADSTDDERDDPPE